MWLCDDAHTIPRAILALKVERVSDTTHLAIHLRQRKLSHNRQKHREREKAEREIERKNKQRKKACARKTHRQKKQLSEQAVSGMLRVRARAGRYHDCDPVCEHICLLHGVGGKNNRTTRTHVLKIERGGVTSKRFEPTRKARWKGAPESHATRHAC